MLVERIEYLPSIDEFEWDGIALALGGSYFHSYAYARLQTNREGMEPLFVKALARNGECIGVAVCLISSPRLWPASRLCKTAVIGALPASKGDNPDLQLEILQRLEVALRRRGVFQIEISSYESPNSEKILTSFSGHVSDRVEFYIDLSRPEEDVWKSFVSTRRNDIRKAEKLGVQSRMYNIVEGVELLYKFQTESLERRGIQFDSSYIAPEQLHRTILVTKRADLLVSYRDGIAINAGLFGTFGTKAYYLASGSSREGYKCCGPAHLLWTAMRLLQSRGMTRLNLGGVDRGYESTNAGKNGLYNFKNDFGGAVVQQPRCIKTISRLGANINGTLLLSRRLLSR